MRKIIMFNMVSLDGYFANEDGSIDWHNVDDEFNVWAAETVRDFGGIIFGRVTYDMFEQYWPAARKDPTTTPQDMEIATFIDECPKYLVSKSKDSVKWQNTTLWHDLDAEVIKKLKAEDGKDLVIYGSGTVVQALTNMGLIDEYRIMVNPTILGKGKPLFAGVSEPHKLKRVNTKEFANDNVLLTYSPA